MILELKNTYEFHQLKSFQFHFSKHKKSFFWENIRTFLTLGLESSIVLNIRIFLAKCKYFFLNIRIFLAKYKYFFQGVLFGGKNIRTEKFRAWDCKVPKVALYVTTDTGLEVVLESLQKHLKIYSVRDNCKSRWYTRFRRKCFYFFVRRISLVAVFRLSHFWNFLEIDILYLKRNY